MREPSYPPSATVRLVTNMDDYTTWKVLPDPSGWIIQEDPSTGFESRHKDIAVAIDHAKRLAMENAPGQVIVKAEDGSVMHAVVFGASPQDPDVTGSGHAATEKPAPAVP